MFMFADLHFMINTFKDVCRLCFFIGNFQRPHLYPASFKYRDIYIDPLRPLVVERPEDWWVIAKEMKNVRQRGIFGGSFIFIILSITTEESLTHIYTESTYFMPKRTWAFSNFQAWQMKVYDVALRRQPWLKLSIT